MIKIKETKESKEKRIEKLKHYLFAFIEEHNWGNRTENMSELVEKWAKKIIEEVEK